MKTFLVLSRGEDAMSAKPIFASDDPALILAVLREVAAWIDAEEKRVRDMRSAHLIPFPPRGGALPDEGDTR